MNLVPQKLEHNDPKVLQEIYHLRVLAWEDAGIITRDQYPNGWSDELDEDAVHFIVKDADRVIGSARVAVVNDVERLPFWKYFDFKDPIPIGKIAFFSRLTILPEYRGYGLSDRFDDHRLQLRKNK